MAKVFAVLGGLVWLLFGCPNGAVGLFIGVVGGMFAWLFLKFFIFDLFFGIFR